MSGEAAPGPSDLHRDAFVFDGHNDLALRLLEGDDPARRTRGGHLDVPRMRDGGMDGGVFALWVDPDAEDPLSRTLDGLGTLAGFLERAEGVRPILRTADLEAARRDGDVAAVMAVEGAYGVGGPSDVARIHEAGARCVTLTWDAPTAWADAAEAEPVHGGLTELGGRVLHRVLP